jgi:hypothetical protein
VKNSWTRKLAAMIQSSTCFIRALYAQNTNVNAYRLQNVIRMSSINTHLFLVNSSISAMSFAKNVTTCSRAKPVPRLLTPPGSRACSPWPAHAPPASSPTCSRADRLLVHAPPPVCSCTVRWPTFVLSSTQFYFFYFLKT